MEPFSDHPIIVTTNRRKSNAKISKTPRHYLTLKPTFDYFSEFAKKHKSNINKWNYWFRSDPYFEMTHFPKLSSNHFSWNFDEQNRVSKKSILLLELKQNNFIIVIKQRWLFVEISHPIKKIFRYRGYKIPRKSRIPGILRKSRRKNPEIKKNP